MIEILKNIIYNKKYGEFIRFCIVGVGATLIDALFFYLFRFIFPYQISLILGYLISLIFNYILTVFWTFNQNPSKRNVCGVLIAHLINLFIVRMGLMWLFINVARLNDQLAYIPTLFISVLTNFFIVRFFVKGSL